MDSQTGERGLVRGGGHPTGAPVRAAGLVVGGRRWVGRERRLPPAQRVDSLHSGHRAREGRCQRPVLVFLFAEGFQAGSNMRFDGALLAALSDMVVVAPNFRLGVLGFYHRGIHSL
ncbi:hypothetical protein HPB48_021880 [Haemaphysalis longicornis]|uniref:Carboxylesterase type B domain-containing protein n=1 Tax=Haemaphysalis longicornis TaxID=44386 RepID=A0A9J6GSW9_HAELO|nr:hypothetical protein HPB48_021880 [Haemaphysalis longicornis]